MTINITSDSISRLKHQRFRLVGSICVLLTIFILGAYSGLLKGAILSWWSDIFWTMAALAAGWLSLLTARKRLILK